MTAMYVSLVLYGIVLFCTASLLQGSKLCGGIHNCDVGVEYCSDEIEPRCLLCKDVERSCFTGTMPEDCARWCLERKLEEERESLCPPLTNVTFMHNASAHPKPGEIVEITCPAGFHVDGPNYIQCHHGEWSPSFPTCVETLCDIPIVDNGMIETSDGPRKVGTHAAYTCNAGFMSIAQGAEALCSESGTWKGLGCVPIELDEPDRTLLYIAIPFSFLVGIVVALVALQIKKWRVERKNANKDRDPETPSSLSTTTLSDASGSAAKNDVPTTLPNPASSPSGDDRISVSDSPYQPLLPNNACRPSGPTDPRPELSGDISSRSDSPNIPSECTVRKQLLQTDQTSDWIEPTSVGANNPTSNSTGSFRNIDRGSTTGANSGGQVTTDTPSEQSLWYRAKESKNMLKKTYSTSIKPDIGLTGQAKPDSGGRYQSQVCESLHCQATDASINGGQLALPQTVFNHKVYNATDAH